MPEEAASALELAMTLFHQLRRRRFPIGVSDLESFRLALAAGFGWSSRDALCDLIVALWAKSRREADTARALFARLDWPPEWTAQTWASPPPSPEGTAADPILGDTGGPSVTPVTPPARPTAPLAVRGFGSLPPLSLATTSVSDARLLLSPQYPLTHREIAQAFRRLRRPTRFGPPTELDVETTVARRARTGVASPPVLVPPRRNTSRLLLLVDVDGSMAPYADFVRMFCEAVREAGWLQQVAQYYFHDVPAARDDGILLDDLGGGFFPSLDAVLARIEPASGGELFLDERLSRSRPLTEALAAIEPGTVALAVGDAGAARARTDLGRLLATLAFIKALRRSVRAVVWLNPVPQPHWANTIAGQLARHVPMYELDRRGIHLAVNALRGQPVSLERPL